MELFEACSLVVTELFVGVLELIEFGLMFGLTTAEVQGSKATPEAIFVSNPEQSISASEALGASKGDTNDSAARFCVYNLLRDFISLF